MIADTLPMLPFLDPDRLTWKERDETEQEANRRFSMGKLIPLGAVAYSDKKIWGFYVEQPRARYVYVFVSQSTLLFGPFV